ncbi:hypothetical protein CFOL_v3_13320, partial [Cephalotus follicularis]
MRFLRRIAGILGFSRDDGHEFKDQEEPDQDDDPAHHQPIFHESGLPRKGFSVPVQVAVDRSQPGPVLIPCTSGDGGVQGLKWHAKRLRIDEDGDVAEEFLDEVLPEAPHSAEVQDKPFPRFVVKYSARPAKVRNQIMSCDGKIQQCVEHGGRLQWV